MQYGLDAITFGIVYTLITVEIVYLILIIDGLWAPGANRPSVDPTDGKRRSSAVQLVLKVRFPISASYTQG